MVSQASPGACRRQKTVGYIALYFAVLNIDSIFVAGAAGLSTYRISFEKKLAS